MLGAALVQSSHGVLYGFATLHWRQAGIPDSVIGALWAEGVVAEIILFAVSGYLLKRLKPIHFLIIAASAGIIRWLILAETSAIPALIFVQSLHAFTFGATHLAGLHFIKNDPRQICGNSTEYLLQHCSRRGYGAFNHVCWDFVREF